MDGDVCVAVVIEQASY